MRIKGARLTSEKLQTQIRHTLLDLNCTAKMVIVAGGAHAVDPHDVGHGPLRAHEAIIIDIFPQHVEHGYWGDLTRTVVRGQAAPELRAMYRAVRSAHAGALARVKAGVRALTIAPQLATPFVNRLNASGATGVPIRS
ncbi:MAG: aminopeptidase P family protein [Acidobacteria bacterium]|nr:aminopeptidase P family protein [Acidobacteriota bacterium]